MRLLCPCRACREERRREREEEARRKPMPFALAIIRAYADRGEAASQRRAEAWSGAVRRRAREWPS